MNTIDELLYYCDEPEPAGALLLSGEWGCGKTYLIKHNFSDAIKDKAVVVCNVKECCLKIIFKSKDHFRIL